MKPALLLGSLALALALPTPASAQIVEVAVRERAVRGLGKFVEAVDGRHLLRGEPFDALEARTDAEIAVPESGFSLFVSDPDDPEDVPYTWKLGERSARSKARLVRLSARDVESIRMIAADLSLENLRDEVRERRALLERLERARDREQRGSEAWLDAHFWLLENRRRLQFLLGHYGFAPAATELDAGLAALAKAAADDPRSARARTALGSIRRLDPSTRLVEAARAISGGRDTFAVHESRHLRLVHDARIDERRARELLSFGEEVIEGFRRELVDRYECADLVPERPFAEFWFGPDDDESFARYFEDYYGLSWGTEEEKQDSLRYYGHYETRGNAPEYLSYCRAPWRNLFGLLAHRLGEVLAALHYGASLSGGDGSAQPWLREALGIHASMEWIGASTTACVSFGTGTFSKTEARLRRRGERPALYFRALARSSQRPLDHLVLRELAELGGQDVAKGWSLLRHLLDDGERGQEALHALTRLSREPATLLPRWREELAWLYAVDEGRDALDELEKSWRASLPDEDE